MTAAPLLRYSFQDYLEVEAASETKHEYLDGLILAMAGGSPEHAAIAAAVATSLSRQLAGRRCRVFSVALRVRVPKTGFAGYPDVSVICEKLESDIEDKNAAINPTVLVEILSPSTEAYDRGEKLRQYRQFESVQHIVLVAHDRHELEILTRGPDGFSVSRAGPGAEVELAAIQVVLNVDELYRDPLAG